VLYGGTPIQKDAELLQNKETDPRLSFREEGTGEWAERWRLGWYQREM